MKQLLRSFNLSLSYFLSGPGRPGPYGFSVVLCLCFIMLIASLLSPSVQAEVVLNISRQAYKKLGIAVAPIDASGQSGSLAKHCKDIHKIMESDMHLSGYLTPILRKKQIASLHRQDRTKGTIDFGQWRNLGAAFLVKGTASVGGNNVIITMQLYSVPEGRAIISKRYSASSKDMRKIVHTIDHAIVKTITGEDSIFLTRLAYTSRRTGTNQIYTCDFDGFNMYAITRDRTMNMSPSWVPGKNALLCTSYITRRPVVQLLDLGRGSRKMVSTHPGLNALAKASPDGQYIVQVLSKDGNPELYRSRIDGSGLTRLTYTRAVESSPCFSPDGKQIAYVSNTTGSPQIYLMNLSSRKARRLTYKGRYNCHPDWAPKGNRLVYASRRGGRFALCVLDLSSNKETVLNTAGNAENPCWAPNGIHITYTAKRNGRNSVFITDIYGLKPFCVTRGRDNCRDVSWSR